MKLYDVITAEKRGKKESEPPREEFRYTDEYSPKKVRRHIIIYGLLFIAIGALYALGVKFVHATVTIEERKIPFTIEGATLDLEHEKTAEPGRLTYQAMVVNSTITREIFGSEVTSAETHAAGPVVFLNEYSKSAVTIGPGTTLISQDKNKKYITKEKVTVPGFTMSGSKKIAGSSSPVTITATDIGDASNTTGTSFYVSAYTGTKKTQLYARSSGAITGGESGSRHTVTASEKDKVIDSLQTQLIERLRRESRAQIPAGYITYQDLQVVSVDVNSLVIEGQGIKFPASLSGTMVSYLIPEKEFEQALSAIVLSDHTYPSVSIPTIANLQVSSGSALSQSTSEFPDTITVKISGQGTIITNVSDVGIQNVLLGQKRAVFDQALQNIREIDHASYQMLPFWASYFPAKNDRINIVIK